MARRGGIIRGRISGPEAGIDPGPAGIYATDFTVGGEGGIYQTVANISGMVDSGTALLSLWFYLDTSNKFLFSVDPSNVSNAALNFTVDGARRIAVNAQRSIGGFALNFISETANPVSLSTWHHLLMSWDIDNSTTYAYLDDVDVWTNAAVNNHISGSPVEYTEFGGNPNTFTIAGGDLIGNPLNGCLSTYWFDSNQFLDITVTANRRLFTAANGAPIPLGADGSKPTGTPPLLYFDNPYTSFNINRGTGGNFLVFGTPGECADAPADQF